MASNTPQSLPQDRRASPESQAGQDLGQRPEGMSDADWLEHCNRQQAQAGTGGTGGLQGEKARRSGGEDTPGNT